MSTIERSPALQGFLDSVKRAVETSAPRPETQACLRRVFAALATPKQEAVGDGTRLPACDYLDAALEPAIRRGGALKEVALGIAALAPLLSWDRREGAAPTASESFRNGHANTMIVGPGGIEDRRDVWVGLSLLAPDVRYPDHNHSPEEIYLVLTDGRFRHGNDDWETPGIGGTFHNKPGIVHAMASSGHSPFLAVWCLFDPRAM
ncbi:dimethylsulfonioproprionate lyase family protein [Shinella sp. BYT-45]|uniref:dimethylsulfonioproprionate lyase family protein n=1 Tax=Shinella sp. BYT-45 TaxID=3377377 RepID=UPI0039809B7F